MNVVYFPSERVRVNQSDSTEVVARRARIGARIAGCNKVEREVAGSHAAKQYLAGVLASDAIASGVNLAKGMMRNRTSSDKTPTSSA